MAEQIVLHIHIISPCKAYKPRQKSNCNTRYTGSPVDCSADVTSSVSSQILFFLSLFCGAKVKLTYWNCSMQLLDKLKVFPEKDKDCKDPNLHNNPSV